MRWRSAVMAALATLLLSSCSVGVAGTAFPAAAPASPPAGQTPPSTGPGSASAVPADADPAQVAADATAAEKIVGGYWIKHFTEDFGSPYQAPTILGIYDGRHPDPHLPTCAGQTLPPDNALYCSEGDFLAFDKGLLSREAEFGNAWVFLIVAHEWGHSIQQRIGASLTAAEAELQADCFAGATLYGAAADGDLTFEAGDVKAITRSLTEVADETPWGQGGDHGDPFQRIGAFDLGRTGGVRGCLPMNPG